MASRTRTVLALVSAGLAPLAAPAWGQWQQNAKLTASDGSAGDRFGVSVSLNGGTLLVGADLDDQNGQYAGSAYVFELDGEVWTPVAKLTPSDGAADNYFGQFVSVSEDTAAIGASGHLGHGAVYVFERISGTWTQTGELHAADGSAGDNFGHSVCIDADTVFVGAPGRDDHGNESGAVYIFERTAGVWTQFAKLTAPDGAPEDRFGKAVSVSGDSAFIGAFFDDDNGLNSGSAYVFERVDGEWSQVQKLTPSDGSPIDQFGISATIDGTTAIVGAEYDDDNGTDSGSAYVFDRIGGVWTEVTKLTAPDGTAGDHFGWSVAISGDTIGVGANWADVQGSDSGSAYVFRRASNSWTQIAKVSAPDGAAGDWFGHSVAVGDDMAVVGSYWDDDAGTDSGSVYVFQPCLADLTGDGVVDTLDFLLFLGAWSQGHLLADWDKNGTVNTLDFLAYLNDWSAGCA